MKTIIGLSLLLVFLAGYAIPETRRIPVAQATPADWNPQSFWYYPWGRSGTHKGIDIFASAGTPVLAATSGLVVAQGYNSMGGNTVLVLGAKWRLHYYAHLQDTEAHILQWLKPAARIGTVGNSGNAQNKPAHLHYSILSLIPNPAHFDHKSPQAWKKMFYINPHQFLLSDSQ